MINIAISYRRADSDAIAGRIRDKLVSHFGSESVFMDVDSIPFGIDFREHIQETLAHNDILVAIMGPKWLGEGRGGGARIMEETDPVRIEIETALRNGNAVIPVLIGEAKMPEPGELPESLKNLTFRNAAEVDAGRDFHQHMERLIRSMEFILAKKGKTVAAAVATNTPPAEVRLVPNPTPVASTPTAAPVAVLAQAATIETKPSPVIVNKQRPALIAAVATVLLLAGGGTWFLWPRPEPKPEPKVEEPKVVQVLRSGGTTTVTTGCKLDMPVALADNFKTVDPGWSLTDQNASYVDGELALNAALGTISRVLYPSFRFKNVTLCAQIRSPAKISSSEGTQDGGLMFWVKDLYSFYNASIYPNGTYRIDRMVDKSWIAVAPTTPFAGILQGANAVNEIQVRTQNDIATVYINGTKAHEFKGQPPPENSTIGSAVGLYGASSKDERNEWRFVSVVVADPDRQQQRRAENPPAPQIALECKPLRTAAFEDKFKSVDPGWGIVANTAATIEDGALVLKPLADKVQKQQYPSLLFTSATACTRVKSPAQITDLSDAEGGLAFWGANSTNYYFASVFPDGRFRVRRIINNQNIAVLPAVKSDAVKAGAGATNELMVSYRDDMAALYINGQKVFEFRGQPPQSGGSIGVFASSEAARENEWRFLGVTVVDN